MKKLKLVSVPMFNAPGVLCWARHFYRMTNCSGKDKKYFLGVMRSWVQRDAKYCLECADEFIEWNVDEEFVTITVDRRKKK